MTAARATVATGYSVLSLVTASSRRLERSGIDYAHLTPAQRGWMEIDAPEAVWVDGNAIGKSYAVAYQIVAWLRGVRPFASFELLNTPPPVSGLVTGYSYDQMIPLMEKIWHLVPKDEVAPGCGFAEGRGFTGKPPRLILTNGSRISFATYRTGSRRIAGGQYDFVVCDEPVEEAVLGEIRPRLLRRRGRLRLVMTPTPDMPDVSHIRERVEAGKLPRWNVGLSERNCWPTGYPAPWHWQHEIDAYAEGLLEHERGMRISGDWSPVVRGRWIRAFMESKHVGEVPLRELTGWTLSLGIDHGTTGKKQAIVLVAVAGGATSTPRVVVLDEEVSSGFTTTQDDARSVLRLLRRNRLVWTAVDLWTGDVPALARVEDVRKSNGALRLAIAAELSVPVERLPEIRVPHKGRGSVVVGSRTINALFSRDLAKVRPQCLHFRDALLQFDGHEHHPLKDVYDGGRYAIERAISAPVSQALTAHY